MTDAIDQIHLVGLTDVESEHVLTAHEQKNLIIEEYFHQLNTITVSDDYRDQFISLLKECVEAVNGIEE